MRCAWDGRSPPAGRRGVSQGFGGLQALLVAAHQAAFHQQQAVTFGGRVARTVRGKGVQVHAVVDHAAGRWQRAAAALPPLAGELALVDDGVRQARADESQQQVAALGAQEMAQAVCAAGGAASSCRPGAGRCARLCAAGATSRRAGACRRPPGQPGRGYRPGHRSPGLPRRASPCARRPWNETMPPTPERGGTRQMRGEDGMAMICWI